MQSLFNKFKIGLKKTTQKIFKSIKNVFDNNKKINLDSISKIEEILYQSDFGIETTSEIIFEIKKAHKEKKIFQKEDIYITCSSILNKNLQNSESQVHLGSSGSLEVVCLLGSNGVGKTTTAAKLAFLLKNQNLKVLLGACDTFRAAANEQIVQWAKKLNIEIVKSHQGADSSSVAFDSYHAAKKRNHDILILDTAGRLHNKTNLMKELSKLKNVLNKQNENKKFIHHFLLVIDGSLGSNSIDQAIIFNKYIEITGVIITKLDGTSKGGVLVGIYKKIKKPIYYIGLGEKEEDLKIFSKDEYIEALFSD